MSKEQQSKLGIAALCAVGLVIVYLLVLKPASTQSAPSKSEVQAACAGLGTGAAGAIAKWEADGKLKLAAGIAAAMGLTQCSDQLRLGSSP